MKAKFINEKFEEDSDPIHDMGIGVVSKINKEIEDLYEYYRTLQKYAEYIHIKNGREFIIKIAYNNALDLNPLKWLLDDVLKSSILKKYLILPKKITVSLFLKPKIHTEKYYICKVKNEYYDIFNSLQEYYRFENK